MPEANPLLNASGLIDYAAVRPEHVAPPSRRSRSLLRRRSRA